MKDDPLHWLTCPKHHRHRAAIDGWQDSQEVDTTALKVHLLPSRSPWKVKWKQLLHDICDTTGEFHSAPGHGPQHIFSDGTCSGTVPYRFGAWGSINASTNQLVATGRLPGLRQTSARAELTGALAVIKWQLFFQVAVVYLWMDCQYVVDGLHWVFERGSANAHWENYDLWCEIETVLLQLGELRFVAHWVPSHLDWKRMACPFEDWVCYWNSKIDRIVALCNHDRPSCFWSVLAAAQQHHDQVGARLRQFRRFFFAVAAARREDPEPSDSAEHVLVDFVDSHHPSLQDLAMDTPHSLVSFAGWSLCKVPAEFMVTLLSWIFEHSHDDCSVYPLSFIELTLGYASQVDARFPFWNPRKHVFELSLLSMQFERPTLSSLLSLVRSACLHFVYGCDISEVRFDGYNKMGLGLQRPIDGLFVKLQPATAQHCSGLTANFFGHRKYRRACDLARPIH